MTLDKVKAGDTVYVLSNGEYSCTVRVKRITPTMIVVHRDYVGEERFNKKTGIMVMDKKFKWLFNKYTLSPTKPIPNRRGK